MLNRAIRKVKVLGYPFGGGQSRCGVQFTPGYLEKQSWFQDLCQNHPIEYEEITDIPDKRSNRWDQCADLEPRDVVHAKNIDNVMAACE